jgi:hypothetical protein
MLLTSDVPKALIRILDLDIPKLTLPLGDSYFHFISLGGPPQETRVHHALSRGIPFLSLQQPPECRKTISTPLLGPLRT